MYSALDLQLLFIITVGLFLLCFHIWLRLPKHRDRRERRCYPSLISEKKENNNKNKKKKRKRRDLRRRLLLTFIFVVCVAGIA